jgi:hypothetical protein
MVAEELPHRLQTPILPIVAASGRTCHRRSVESRDKPAIGVSNPLAEQQRIIREITEQVRVQLL